MNNAEILLAALRGQSALRERKKSLAREHDERIKRLGTVIDQIQKSDDDGSLELASSAGVSLSPELKHLLENPVRGL